jgi:S1-C subfamily serine protease
MISLAGAQVASRGEPSQGTLGIDIVPLTPELAEFLQMPYQAGLFVASVNKHTAFDRAGVVAGDVILEVDGVKLGNPQTFYDQIKEHGWGGRLIVRLLRKGVELSKTVQLPWLSPPRQKIASSIPASETCLPDAPVLQQPPESGKPDGKNPTKR